MKTYRPLVVLFVFLCGLAASAQDSSEFASLRAKAVKGNGIAQYNLGLAYVQGKGTAADPIEAFVWLSLARENGARGRALDNLVSSLDRTTYEVAQKRLAERKTELGLRPATTTPATATGGTTVQPDNRPATVAAAGTTQTGTPADDAALAQLRAERDGLAVRINNLAGDLADLRAERERLIKLSGDHEKTAREAAEAGRATQAELERTRQALATLQSAPKPAADTSALDQKTRELQAALAELETSRKFGSQVESTLNRVTDQKTALDAQLASANQEVNRARQEAAALAKARDETQQQLGAIAAEHRALQSEVAQFRSRPATPAYPDLAGRVAELETALAAARKPAAPAYPDLSGRVRELESSLADSQRQLAAKPAAPGYPDLSGRVRELESSLADSQRQLAARPVAPRYPDLSGRVTELETALAAARKPVAPAYPDLSGRVRELESSLADTQRQLSAKPAAPSYPDLSGRVRELESSLADTQRQLAAKPAAPAWPDLRSNVAALEGQLASAQQALAARSKPVADTTALDQKNRELQAALAELEASREFGRKVEETLNKVNDEKARVAATAAAELEAARKFGSQVESTLNRVTDQKTALDAQLASANQEVNHARQEAAALAKARDEAQQQLGAIAAEHRALQSEVAQFRSRPAAPAYPDLSGRVAELETALAAARKQAAPAATELSGRIGELETALADTNRQLIAAQNAAAKTAAPTYPDLSGRVTELETALATSIQKFGATEQARAELSKQFDDFRSATITAQRERTTMLAQVKMLESDKAALRRQAEAATAETGQLRTQLAALKMQQVAIKPATPAYPDLSGKVGELENQVNSLQAALAARPAAPAYPDLSSRVRELEAQVATRPAAPAYPDLSGRVSELEGQLARARQPAAPRYPDLSGRVRELETQVSSLASDATRAKQELVTLSQEKAAGSSALATAQQESAAARAQLANLTAERDSARQAQGELRDTITKLTQEKAALAAAGNAAPSYPDLRDRVASLESDLAALSSAANRTKQEIAALTKAKEDAQQALAARPAAPTYPDLSGRVTELTAEVGQLRADRERMQQMLADAGRQLRDGSAAASRLKELETQNAGLQSALAARPATPGYPDLSGRVTELETALAAARNATPAYPDLSGRVRELEAQVSSAVSAVASAKAEAASAKLEVAALTKAQEERTAPPASPDLSGRVAELAGEIAQLRTDRERMQKMLADAGRQLRDGTADAARIKDLEAQLAGARARPVAPPGYLDRVRELETALAEAKAAAQPAAPGYPDLSGRVRELETAAAESARQLIAAEAAQAGLKQQLAEAGSALQNATRTGDDSAKLRRERDELSGRVTELAGELAQLRTDRERMQKMLADAGRQLRDNTADTVRIKELETQLAAIQAQAGGLAAERDTARSAQNELRETIARLEQEKSRPAATQPAAPAYPDLSGRVRELEAQVASLAGAPRGRAPAYPDLSGRVSELEAALAEARARPAVSSTPAAGGADPSELQQKLAATEDRLATALRGYTLLERERDELATTASRNTEAVAAERNALAAQVNTLSSEVEQLRAGAQNSASGTQAEIARLNEALTALQRSTAQNATDLAATRALAQQLQGANAVLAGENYQLKTMLSRTVSLPVSTPAAAPAPRTHVVANGDSLSRISQRYYGTANRWQEIFNANTDRINANGILRIGTELRIP